MTIKLAKIERRNTYISTCDILLNGTCIGELEINYSYTRKNKLRIDSYFVKLQAGQYKRFEVDGRWETKKAIYTQWGWESTYLRFESEYKTAKAAKAAAKAYIAEITKVNH